MKPAEIAKLLKYLSPDERQELEVLLADAPVWLPMAGPQQQAFSSMADVVGFGGAAGGGKSSLAVGLALTQHKKSIIFRQNGTELTGVIDEMTRVLGGRDGYNGAERIWRLVGRQVEFGSFPNPGDETKYQGRDHDLIIYDEAANMRESAVRFLMGWLRTADAAQRCRVLMTFNPPTTAEGRWIVDYFAPWLDKKHPNPAKAGELRWFAVVNGHEVEVKSAAAFVHDGELITPKSRTFIPSRVTDNPFLIGTGYQATLQALPEPLRSQMLNGDFSAGVEDDPWQVIPTSWVEAAQVRWVKPAKLPSMDSVGVDVARGGRDNTIIARRHGAWFDEPLVYPGAATPDGNTVAALSLAARRDMAVIHIDVIGVGSSPYDFLREAGQQVVGVNVAEKARGVDKSGRLAFFNLRSELWWRMREWLDPASNTGAALPPDKRLTADLCAPTWSLSGSTLKVASREEILAKIGRSPDFGSAYVLGLMDTPKLSVLKALGTDRRKVKDYDPYS